MFTRRHSLALFAAAAPGLAWARVRQETGLDLPAVLAASGAPAVGGVWLQGEIVWQGVAGRRAAENEATVTPADPWHLGSNTKAMTAALVARYVEQGRLGWEARLGELLPEIAMDAAWRQTPLTALLAHEGGLLDTDLIGPAWLASARADTRPLAAQRAAFAAEALVRPPTGTPGAFAYGNANYIVAGAALEALTGQSWEAQMQAELFAPLGMACAGFGPPAGDAPRGHQDAAGQLLSMAPEAPGADNPAALGPAGTVHAPLADYARFLAVFTGAGDWLTAASVTRLTTPSGPASSYALGWGVTPQPWAAGPVLVHEGSNTRWHAIALVDRDGGRAMATVSNGGPRGRAACVGLAQAMLRTYAG
ncbi:MAG TPA: serine hydrolase domain-containing protein [Brevundimonas sp.]|jgi:CubicO group peptidase (beta-lactamase class C family)|uniref:serine hydrolase domain-containing protein n=1 Tax=Brevundimonas sp. TaxID=1871086 RepID=UPI002E127DCE|nr:serine hydrolase domain-containing protein [Brevundimonas sp.]